MYYYIKCNNRGIVYVMICDVMRMMMILFVKIFFHSTPFIILVFVSRFLVLAQSWQIKDKRYWIFRFPRSIDG